VTGEIFAPLRIQKASELLAERVRGAILEGDLAEGGTLPPEKVLMAQFGVSRATVREGLRLLEAEGLITTRAGRGGGATVRRPTASRHTRSLALLLQFDRATLGELLEARRAIEPFAARLAAQRGGAAAWTDLAGILGELGGLIHDRAAYLAAQNRFHVAIVEVSGNAVLRIYARSLGELARAEFLDVPFTPEDLAGGVTAGAAILEALRQGDGERAERRVARHLEAIEAAVVRLGWPLGRRPAALAFNRADGGGAANSRAPALAGPVGRTTEDGSLPSLVRTARLP
jgi:DNA-binding FadR family transcriptional regulator